MYRSTGKAAVKETVKQTWRPMVLGPGLASHVSLEVGCDGRSRASGFHAVCGGSCAVWER